MKTKILWLFIGLVCSNGVLLGMNRRGILCAAKNTTILEIPGTLDTLYAKENLQILNRLIKQLDIVKNMHKDKKDSTYSVALKHRFLNKLILVDSKAGIEDMKNALGNEKAARGKLRNAAKCSVARHIFFGAIGAVITYHCCEGFLEFLSDNVAVVTNCFASSAGGAVGMMLSSGLSITEKDVMEIISRIYTTNKNIFFYKEDLDAFEKKQREERKNRFED